MFAPILEEFSKTKQVIKFELDENQEFATQMQVQSIPTTFFYKNAQIIDKFCVCPQEVLEAKLKVCKSDA